MKRLQLKGNKAVRVEKEMVRTVAETVNGLVLPVRHTMSVPAHKVLAGASTRGIFDTTYAVDAVLVRAAKSETNGDVYVYGTFFKTLVNNSPYTKALVKANGDFDKTDMPVVQIKHFDKKAKELVDDYRVTCNTINEKGVKTIATSAICIVDFSMLESDLNKIFRWNKEQVAKHKRILINKVINLGLEVREEGNSKKRIYTGKHNVTGTHYQVISWSPSNQRNETAVFTSLDQGQAFNILDKVSGGTLSNALCRNRKIKDLIKFSARIGILSSPSTEMVEFGNEKYGCMIYMKETMGPEDYTAEEKAKLEKIGVEIDRNTYDGAIVYSAEYIKEFLERVGRKVSLAQANLMAIQSRCTTLLSKVFGEGKSKMNIDFRAARYRAMVPKDRILEVPAGTDVSDLNKEDYDLIVVGNPKNIAIIMDINGGKALKDISLQQIVNGRYMNYLLDVAKCSETVTSGQMIQKFMAVSKELTIRILERKIFEQFNVSLTKFLEGDIDTKECSLAQFLLRHCPEALSNTEVVKTVIDTEMDIIASQLKNYKVKIDAIFLRALFDDAYFITNGAIDGVLGVSKYTGKLEAYSYDVEVRYKEQIDAIYADDSIVNKEEALDKLLTGIAFKYPSPSADESAAMTFKTSRVLAERIANMNILTRQQREVLLDDFINTSFGVIKMAPNNTIKHRLAGMDTDFDGVAIVFEKDLVELVLDKEEFTTIKSTK